MARNLGDDRGYFGLQRKHSVVDEEAANSPKIYRAEEIFKVEIEDKASFLMHFSIGYNGAAPMKAMGGKPKPTVSDLLFVHTVIEQNSKASLQQGESWLWRMDSANAARFFRNIKRTILLGRVHLVENKADTLWGEAK
ncbi:hypothetical protein JCM17960_18270 [Magnetospira thiophila]